MVENKWSQNIIFLESTVTVFDDLKKNGIEAIPLEDYCEL